MFVLIQCPVCQLFLNPGMSIEQHLQTHSMDLVIKSLASIMSRTTSTTVLTTTGPSVTPIFPSIMYNSQMMTTTTSSQVTPTSTIISQNMAVYGQLSGPAQAPPAAVPAVTEASHHEVTRDGGILATEKDFQNDNADLLCMSMELLEEPALETEPIQEFPDQEYVIFEVNQKPVKKGNPSYRETVFTPIDVIKCSDDESNSDELHCPLPVAAKEPPREKKSECDLYCPLSVAEKEPPEEIKAECNLSNKLSSPPPESISEKLPINPMKEKEGFQLISNVKLTPKETMSLQRFINKQGKNPKSIKKGDVLPAPEKSKIIPEVIDNSNDEGPTVAVVTSVIRRVGSQPLAKGEVSYEVSVQKQPKKSTPPMQDENASIKVVHTKPPVHSYGRKIMKIKQLKPIEEVPTASIIETVDLTESEPSSSVEESIEQISEMTETTVKEDQVLPLLIEISSDSFVISDYEETADHDDDMDDADERETSIVEGLDEKVTQEIVNGVQEAVEVQEMEEVQETDEEFDDKKPIKSEINFSTTAAWVLVSGPSTSKSSEIIEPPVGAFAECKKEQETFFKIELNEEVKEPKSEVLFSIDLKEPNLDTVLDNSISSESSFSHSLSSTSGYYGQVNIRTDEQMPAKGEISEQESNADLDTAWNMKQEIFDIASVANSHDTNVARESWTYCSNELGAEKLNFNFLHTQSSSSAADNTAEPPVFIKEMDTTDVNPLLDDDSDSLARTKTAKGEPIARLIKPRKNLRSYVCFSCPKVFQLFRQRKEHMLLMHKDLVTRANIKHSKPKLQTCPRKTPFNSLSLTPTGTQFFSEKTLSLAEMIKSPHKLNRLLMQLNFKILGENTEVSEDVQKLILAQEMEKTFFCMECKEQFSTFTQLKKHTTIHPIICYSCNRSYKDVLRFIKHMKQQHLGMQINYPCPDCSRSYSSRRKMEIHRIAHARPVLKCSFCSRVFMHYSRLQEHKQRAHFNVQPKRKEFLCHCGEVCYTQAKFTWHQETHDKKPKACPFCRERFIHKNSLSRHIRLAHMDRYPEVKKDSVECPICKKRYIKTSLKLHMATHKSKTSYECTICNKELSTKWNLKIHKWTHDNRSSMPYKCNQCQKGFIRMNDLQTHIYMHKQIKPYTCDYCGCQFGRKYNWLRHTREHEVDKKHKCKVCHKTFHRAYYLKEHIRSHTNERPFECSICGKTSATKTNHNKHLKIHHARDIAATEG